MHEADCHVNHTHDIAGRLTNKRSQELVLTRSSYKMSTYTVRSRLDKSVELLYIVTAFRYDDI